jgi:hypothetical protein
VARNIFLPDDVYVHIDGRPGTANDRHYVPRWYAETSFSLVTETMVSGTRTRGLFVSEKTFKPLAHSHAFVVQGCDDTLSYLHSLGFETFAHVINESYDQKSTFNQKLQTILTVLEDLYREFKTSGAIFQDTKTQQILTHNRELFFNQDRVGQLFKTQLAEPIIAFAESQ